MNTVENLDILYDLRSQRDVLDLQKADAKKLAIPAELIKTLEDIEVEFSGRLEIVNKKIEDLEKEIKSEVLELGATIKGAHLQAIWNKGRVSWNTKGLDGYLIAHPELRHLRKKGKPSVSIRGIGGTK